MSWISPYIGPVLTIIITIIVARTINSLLKRSMLMGIGKDSDKTHYVLTRRIIVFCIYILGILFTLFSIPQLKTWAVSMLASAGVIALIIGLASKNMFENMISGIFIAIYKPYRIGDRILYKGDKAIVEDINFRHTVLVMGDNNRLIVPNGNISAADIINYTNYDERTIIPIEFLVGYNTNISLARKIIIRECKNNPLCLNTEIMKAKGMMEHLRTDITSAKATVSYNKLTHGGMDQTNPIIVRVIDWGDNGIRLCTWLWTENNVKAFILKCEILETVKKCFDNKKISIPYPHRTIVYEKKGFKKVF